ncbi:MAG TPA: hypothetical protein VGE51_16830 [Fontimonas sp.]
MRRFAAIHSSLFLAVVLGLGTASVLRLQAPSLPAAVEVRVGEAARRFESHYDAVFPAKTFGINFWAAVQYVAFGEGRSGVVVGSDDWLYSLEEFRGWPDGEAQIETRLQQIVEAREQLAQRGTTLVVALVPAKADIYAEHQGERRPDAVHAGLYERALGGLRARGLMAADLRSALLACKQDQAVFLRTDTHWTPDGARCAAAAIGTQIESAGLATQQPQTFHRQIDPAREHAGDLINFLPLAPHFAGLLPAFDRLVPEHTAAAEADLLGDAPPPGFTLLGTSYSADPLWNFDGALRERLHADVLNLAESGHGPFKPMQAYLRAPDSPQAPVLIWEIPVRYLPMEDTPASAQPPSHQGETA